MGESIEIYGTKITLPDLPKEEDILNYNLPKKEQKWIKQELPLFFNKVEFNKSGDLLLTSEQEKFAAQEVKSCKVGVHVYINGVVKYLPPKYYFYLQYYVL